MATDKVQQKDKSRWEYWLHILGWVLVGLLLIAIGLVLFPLKTNRQMVEKGLQCNANLEILFSAKQALVEQLRIDPTHPLPADPLQPTLADLAPFLPNKNQDIRCPSGGKYVLGTLMTERGEIIVPVCEHEREDPDGNGRTNVEEGLHIHQRSGLHDPESALFFRDPAFVFAD
jgi:hypothetical protein